MYKLVIKKQFIQPFNHNSSFRDDDVLITMLNSSEFKELDCIVQKFLAKLTAPNGYHVNYKITYFDVSEEIEAIIMSNDELAMFLLQYNDPQVSKEHKRMVVKIWFSETSQLSVLSSHSKRSGSAKESSQPQLYQDSRMPTQSIEFASTSEPSNSISFNDENKNEHEEGFVNHSSAQQPNKKNIFNERYNIIKTKGSGAFGNVYEVALRDDASQKRAIKLIKVDDPNMATRVLKEFQKMVQHRNHEMVVTTYEAFFVDMNTIGIEMELMKGCLQSMIIQPRQVLSEKMVLDVIYQTCKAVDWMQTYHKTVHRDLKPSNILVRRMNTSQDEIVVAIGDFGTARSLDSVSKTGIGGTLHYFAPELDSCVHLRTENIPFTFASDVFALGVAFYQLITFDMATSWATKLKSGTSTEEIANYIKNNMRTLYSDFIVELIASMLQYYAEERATCSQILRKISQHLFPNATLTVLATDDASANLLPSQLSNNCESDYQIGYEFIKTNDYLHAFSWIEKAAQNGHLNAQIHLASMYENGLGIPQNFTKAFEWYEQAANQGDSNAALKISNMYMRGDGMTRNMEKALEWLEKAAELGGSYAQFTFAFYHLQTTKDFSKAFTWFEKAANQGHLSAINNLGNMYMEGIGVRQDYIKAFELYEKGANMDCASCRNNLAWMYENGLGAKKDLSKAFHLYEQAAKDGHHCAQYSLGFMYEQGLAPGGMKDLRKAVEWYEQAALQGNKNARQRLAQLLQQQCYFIRN